MKAGVTERLGTSVVGSQAWQVRQEQGTERVKLIGQR